MIRFSYSPGSRGAVPSADRIIRVHIPDGHALTYEEFGQIAEEFGDNEDRIYPPSLGFKGRKKLRQFLNWVLDYGLKEAMYRKEKDESDAQQYRMRLGESYSEPEERTAYHP